MRDHSDGPLRRRRHRLTIIPAWIAGTATSSNEPSASAQSQSARCRPNRIPQLLPRGRTSPTTRGLVQTAGQPVGRFSLAEWVPTVEQYRWRPNKVQAFGVHLRFHDVEDRADVGETLLFQSLGQAVIRGTPVGAAVEVAKCYSELSSCRFFHSSMPGLWWYRGKTQRKRLRPGFLHQQSG